MPASVGVIILYDGRFLLNDFSAGTGAGHGRAQEHIDDEHNKEHEAKCYTQVHKPGRGDAIFTFTWFAHSWWGKKKKINVYELGLPDVPIFLGHPDILDILKMSHRDT